MSALPRLHTACLILVVLAVSATAGPSLAPGSDDARPSVVELFTSQGCSSCPPADELLGELAGRPNVLALAFHVDYWDSSGWRDRFSIPEAVQRQQRYVNALGLASAFTPQAVVDGHGSFVGSDRHSIVAALSKASANVPMVVQVANGELSVALPALSARDEYDVNFVAYLPQAATAIGRGENSGRTLREYNIVREFRRLGTWDGHPSAFRVKLSSIPADATRAAVLLQRTSQGAIAGVASAALR